MNIHESAEDYLETILMFCEERCSARSVDIAAHLGVTKPSVSFAMKRPVSYTHLAQAAICGPAPLRAR